MKYKGNPVTDDQLSVVTDEGLVIGDLVWQENKFAFVPNGTVLMPTHLWQLARLVTDVRDERGRGRQATISRVVQNANISKRRGMVSFGNEDDILSD